MANQLIKDDLRIKVTNKQILSIAMPITLAILVPQINMLTNSVFLGHYDKDPNALGNAGITGIFYLIFAVAGHGLNNAIQTVFSKQAGSGNTYFFKKILSQGIRISLQLALFGILFTWLVAPIILKNVAAPEAYTQEINFLRIRIFGLPFLYLFLTGNAFLVASLNSRFLIYGFVAEALVNIFLDYVLIFGKFGFPEMGFNGAAVASVIAEITGFLVVFCVLIYSGLKSKYQLLRNLKFHKTISKSIINVSAPLVMQYVLSVTTWLVFFFLIEARGEIISKGVSNVMRNVFGLIGVFVWAFASTSNVVVSNLMGQKREDKVVEAIKKISVLSISFCFTMLLLLNIFPVTFFSMFSSDQDFITAAIPVARVVSVGMLCMSMGNIWLNGVTGTGKTKVNLKIEIAAISLYLIYTFIFMKIHYISLAMAWSNELVYWCSIFIFAFVYLKKGKWKTNESAI